MLTEAGLALDAQLIAGAERALAGKRGAISLPGGALLRLKGGRVRVDARPASAASQRSGNPQARGYLELEGDPVTLAEEGRRLRWTQTAPETRAQPIHPSISGALLVRRRRPGDRVVLASGRTRKLQDVLTDARVPREARNSLIVLADPDDRVVCVVGVWPKPGARARSPASSWLVDAPLASERADPPSLRYKG